MNKTGKFTIFELSMDVNIFFYRICKASRLSSQNLYKMTEYNQRSDNYFSNAK